jgi:elongation factor 2
MFVPKDKRQLHKMVSELRKVVCADSTALFYKDQETQEYILAGAGELHIEVLISTLMQASGIEVVLSDPSFGYRETIQSVSAIALAKSYNKHNRVFIRASPLANEVVNGMTSEEALDAKQLAEILLTEPFKI